MNSKKYILNNMKFIKKHFLENLILVTGTHTSGKSMVSPIIASFHNVEMLRKIYTLDQFAMLHQFKKIDPKISTFMAKHILDISYYDQLIGRNMNFRTEDETSVYQSKNPNFFANRINIKRGYDVIKKHKDKNTHMLLDTHDGLWFYNFWKSIGIKNLKIISVFRNPIDIVNSWINLSLGDAENQELCQIPLIQSKKNLKPFYYYRFMNTKNKNKNDIAVDMVAECFVNDLKSFEKIKNKKKIYRIEFNDFAENTDFIIKKLNNFLKLKKTKFTKNIKLKERLPRVLDKSEREKKLNKIKNLVTKEKYNKLLKLESLFNDHRKKI